MAPLFVLAAIALLGEAGAKRPVIVPGWPSIPIFSAATIVGETVYVSGMVGFDFGKSPPAKCEGGIQAETECALRNVRAVMEAAGSSLENVADCTVFLADIAQFSAMNEVYLKFFPKDPPSRAAFAVASLAVGAAVEIKCLGSL
ncbi:Endoribonuclease L-PSP/chorismate mutase-like protein [Pavlovales sp. CCMP2436]|nr:Endoribonuclease L-PSP/chorismate mutase-like protein [Pavlovales sp. CCMP2436]